jgi:hypothetical protein
MSKLVLKDIQYNVRRVWLLPAIALIIGCGSNNTDPPFGSGSPDAAYIPNMTNTATGTSTTSQSTSATNTGTDTNTGTATATSTQFVCDANTTLAETGATGIDSWYGVGDDVWYVVANGVKWALVCDNATQCCGTLESDSQNPYPPSLTHWRGVMTAKCFYMVPDTSSAPLVTATGATPVEDSFQHTTLQLTGCNVTAWEDQFISAYAPTACIPTHW